MAEDPTAWGPVEKAIAYAMDEATHSRGVPNPAVVSAIANALRERNLIAGSLECNCGDVFPTLAAFIEHREMVHEVEHYP